MGAGASAEANATQQYNANSAPAKSAVKSEPKKVEEEEKMRGVPVLPLGERAKSMTTKGNPMKATVEASGKSMARLSSIKLAEASPDEILTELLNGNMRFITGNSAHPHRDFKRLQELKEHQSPHVAVLGCADSRVPAEIVFDQGFGDMFTCRVAGNLATAEEIASLEYGVLALKVRLIFVLGHTACGAVKAALSGKAFPGFIDTLIDSLDMAVVRAQTRHANNFEELAKLQKAMKNSKGHPEPEWIDMVTRENVMYQIERCRRSTIISSAMKEGALKIVGGVYNLETGEVEMLAH